jgi:FkbM family methyltransferase
MPGLTEPITLISAKCRAKLRMMLLKLKHYIASVLQRITGLRSRLAPQDFLLAKMNAHLPQHDALLARVEAMDLRTQAQDAEVERLTRLSETCILRVSKIENESDVMLKHLTAQYQSLVRERDALLNERDRLLVGLQRVRRPNGFAFDSAQVHAERLDFPSEALPAGTLPKVHIVDIGAQNLTQEEHIYLPLVKAGVARITGFEPLRDAAEKRSAADSSLTMLNHFIGDGSARKFHVNRDDATSSLLPADLEFLGRFEALATMCSPVEIMNITTTKLDDIPEVADCDFLKIDVQGGELDVLKGASNALNRTVVTHCEVEFSRVYKNQPLFGDIDAHMRAAGFELVDIINAGYATVKGLPRPIARSRLLWGDAVYIRSPETIASLGADKIVKAAFIAHVNYGMYDVAASLLAVLDNQAGTHYAKVYGERLATAM